MSSFPCYASHDSNGHEKIISLEEVFEDFIFNDLADMDGVTFGELMGDVDMDNAKNEQSGASSSSSSSSDENGKKRTQARMTDNQKKDRRERNREHAKKSRVRRKFMMESLQQSVKILKSENAKLKTSLSVHLPKDKIEVKNEEASLLAGDGVDGNCSLDNQDYNLVRALQQAQQNFVISDPSLPDNPIVFATLGFLTLTGYTMSAVLGRNCRFLQGPETNLRTIALLSEAVKQGKDYTTVVLNYRADGTSFWNQLFIAALRDGSGSIVNYLGVQCRVSEMYARAFFKKEEGENGQEGEREGEGEVKATTWGRLVLPGVTAGPAESALSSLSSSGK